MFSRFYPTNGYCENALLCLKSANIQKIVKKSILLERVTQEIVWSKYSRKSEGFILSNRVVSPTCANFQSKQTKINGYFSHFPTRAIRSSEYLLILNTDAAISLS